MFIISKTFIIFPRQILPGLLLQSIISRTFIFLQSVHLKPSYYILPYYWKDKSSHIALASKDFKLERQYIIPIWISRCRQREKGGGPARRPFFIDQCSVAFDRYYRAIVCQKFVRARKWRPDMHSDTHAVHIALSHRHPCRRLSAPAFNQCHCSNI